MLRIILVEFSCVYGFALLEFWDVGFESKLECFRLCALWCITITNTANFSHRVRTVPQHIRSHTDLWETLLDVHSLKCILAALYKIYNARSLCYKSFSEILVYHKSARIQQKENG